MARPVTNPSVPEVLEQIEHARHVRDEAEAELAT